MTDNVLKNYGANSINSNPVLYNMNLLNTGLIDSTNRVDSLEKLIYLGGNAHSSLIIGRPTNIPNVANATVLSASPQTHLRANDVVIGRFTHAPQYASVGVERVDSNLIFGGRLEDPIPVGGNAVDFVIPIYYQQKTGDTMRRFLLHATEIPLV